VTVGHRDYGVRVKASRFSPANAVSYATPSRTNRGAKTEGGSDEMAPEVGDTTVD